jgi:hypothetical protein
MFFSQLSTTSDSVEVYDYFKSLLLHLPRYIGRISALIELTFWKDKISFYQLTYQVDDNMNCHSILEYLLECRLCNETHKISWI